MSFGHNLADELTSLPIKPFKSARLTSGVIRAAFSFGCFSFPCPHPRWRMRAYTDCGLIGLKFVLLETILTDLIISRIMHHIYLVPEIRQRELFSSAQSTDLAPYICDCESILVIFNMLKCFFFTCDRPTDCA